MPFSNPYWIPAMSLVDHVAEARARLHAQIAAAFPNHPDVAQHIKALGDRLDTVQAQLADAAKRDVPVVNSFDPGNPPAP